MLKDNYGIEVQEMKNKFSGKAFNFIKAILSTNDKKIKYYQRDILELVSRKFKGFGHIEKNCDKVEKCQKCAGEHVVLLKFIIKVILKFLTNKKLFSKKCLHCFIGNYFLYIYHVYFFNLAQPFKSYKDLKLGMGKSYPCYNE